MVALAYYQLTFVNLFHENVREFWKREEATRQALVLTMAWRCLVSDPDGWGPMSRLLFRRTHMWEMSAPAVV